ncbi:Endonuclease/exonuclease/phosphatase [Halothece sp. PCC 7418]|uniref:Alkaline phosphatase A2 n=1 Tax=Aphanothece halophytica TaxID=72020 RepID=F5HRA6_APHHA|nr:choice-of-anchor I family protein [Halothece sp. PCC 7418]AFZ44988.1 Endonuclease/exonuclease/phosphatase [Halothece sp. PCC 7418]BAK26810.1 alkaline phosphatase A2 [Aphanothece halophytica]
MATIFEIQNTTNSDGSFPEVGNTVTTQGIVTGVYDGGDRVFIQDGPGPWNGLFLFQPNADLEVGDEIEVEGEVEEFFGLTQIANGTVNVLSSGNDLPEAEVLPTGNVGQEQWESVFVRTEDVAVTDANPDGPDDDFGEFAIDDGSGSVRVDDLGDITFDPEGGENLEFLQGPLNFSFSNFKIEPRNNDDLGITISSGEQVPIYEIQGASHLSPFNGESVMTSGIVTAVDSIGFYLQDPNGDNNVATSDGIFVFTGFSSPPDVSVGDEVEVEGEISEFFPGGADTGNLSTTQIFNVSNITELSTGNDLPDATVIGEAGRTPPTENIEDDDFSQFQPDSDGIDFFESLEGMRVTAADAVAVGPTNRFGEIFTVVDGGENATGISDRGTLNISPDDFNPEKVQIDFNEALLANFEFPQVNVGSQLGDVTGVISYDFGNFQIHPTQEFNATDSDLEPETTEIEAGGEQFTIATYNVLNLDPKVEDVALVDDQDSDEVDDDVGEGQFDAIAQQITNNLNTPDIIALQEIQDNDGAEITEVSAADQTLQTLADAIADAGGPNYEFIDTPGLVPAFENEDGEIVRPTGGQPGGNIRNAFLYNPERVDLVEDSVEPLTDPQDQAQNEDNPFFGGRIPLSATFEFNGEQITLVNNHFSSKGGSSPIFGVEQPFEERQEEVEVNGSLDERTRQANAVKDYVDEILNENPNANVVALGDLNEFEFVSPVDEILGSSLNNLTDNFAENERYSFIFQGNSQSLDHILVSDNLKNGASEDIVHTNSEFADSASDHDPLVAGFTFPPKGSGEISLVELGRFETGVFDEGAAEIVAYDAGSERLFVVNSNASTIDILDVSDPSNPTALENSITIGDTNSAFNSVAVNNGIVAVAVENTNVADDSIQERGAVLFYDVDGNFLSIVQVGFLPDMVTFTPDGSKVLVANEGEPNDDYTVDPEGSISIIEISSGVENVTDNNVTEAGFGAFNNQQEALEDAGVRIFGPDATVAQDLEPEYITVNADSTTAYVSLQENNAFAVVDLNSGEVTDILPLGFKDHSLPENELDASDEDGINFQTIPSLGMYQPDSIASFEVDGESYIVTANEGDARDYDTFSEEVGLDDLLENELLDLDDDGNPDVLGDEVFPGETVEDLLAEDRLGELDFTSATGDTDDDGLIEQLYNYGGRSFSVFDESGNLIFDSGDDFEKIIADQIQQGILPEIAFNNDNDENEFDARSDAKGPEPEAIATGVIEGTPYAFIGLERIGGIMVYNLSDPTSPEFVQYINNRNFVDDNGDPISVQLEDESLNPAAGDLGPEGFDFISAEESPNGQPLLAVGNEISGSTTLYGINIANEEPENQPPVASADSLTTNQETVLSVNAENGVLANDSDPDGDTLTITAVNGDSNEVGNEIALESGALLTLNENGSFDYDPNGQFEDLDGGDTESDSFTYTVSDGNGNSDTATVTITINAPIISNTITILQENAPQVVPVSSGFFMDFAGTQDRSRTFNIEEGAGANNLDAGATINLTGTSSDFTYRRDGSTLEILDGNDNLTAEILASPNTTSAVNFDDGSTEVAVAGGEITFGGESFEDGEEIDGAITALTLQETDAGISELSASQINEPFPSSLIMEGETDFDTSDELSFI